MSAKKNTYLKSLLDAEVLQEGKQTKFVFQTERIGLKSKHEIEFLKNADRDIQKIINVSDDELVIETEFPSTYKRFNELLLEDEKTRWVFAQQVVVKVYTHAFPRLNLIVCPENIVFNTGMTPFFLHYGVMESLPPFEKDEERIWLETKAVVAAAVDSSHSFEEYVNYYETLELKGVSATIMSLETPPELLDFISDQLSQLKEKEKTFEHIPQKKWKAAKFLSIGLGIMLVPALIYIIYFSASEKPKNEAYLVSHEFYLGQKYSQVVTALSPYSVEDMPYVVLYELAHSYVINEALTEDQKENVLGNISLQTDVDYLKYWIHIGRNEAEKAADLARQMEDGELLTYSLLKYREEIKGDDKLTGEEKQQLMDEIDSEVDEYRDLMEEQAERRALEKEKEQEKQETDSKNEAKLDAKQEQPDEQESSEQEQPAQGQEKEQEQHSNAGA
jgi:type VII secretion protein EssB